MRDEATVLAGTLLSLNKQIDWALTIKNQLSFERASSARQRVLARIDALAATSIPDYATSDGR